MNPWLDVLRVDALATDGGTEPLAALAVFSIHGTAVPMSTLPYNADLWAYLCDELGDRVAREPRPAAGDRRAAGHARRRDARRCASAPGTRRRPGSAAGIGTAAAALHASLDGELDRRPRLGLGFREVDLRTAPSAAGTPAAVAAGGRRGAAGRRRRERDAGGGEHPAVPAGSGKRVGGRGPHAQKWVVGSRWLQPLVLPLDGFPRVFPVHVVRVGGVMLAGLPMEITTESGRRIADAAAEAWAAAGGDPLRVVVSSVADEYAGYCTTPDEYTLQYYEGGHTLYGPRTLKFFAGVRRRGRRRRRPQGAGARGAARAPVRPRGAAVPAERPAGPSRRAARPPATRVGTGAGRHVAWSWLGPAPGDLRWHETLVRVEAPDGTTLVDDGRGELEVVARRAGRRRCRTAADRYVARWYAGGRDVAGHRLALGPGALGGRRAGRLATARLTRPGPGQASARHDP